MFHKCLGLNKYIIGFVTLVFVLFASKYLEIFNLRNCLMILDVKYAADDYGCMDYYINTKRGNKKRNVELEKVIKRHNDMLMVKNVYKDKVLSQATTIVVVEVRSNHFYLQSLIESLKKAVGVRNSLLIFSHDTFDEGINEIIRNITFAKYIQIYYPYSVEVHPNAISNYESNFYMYDFYYIHNDGPTITTDAHMKHHWWWTCSFVFDRLKATRHFNGTVVFLEEDQGVAADFFCILKLLESLRPSCCPHCQVLSLGISEPFIDQYQVENGTMALTALGSTRELMGIALNRSVWNSFKNLSEHFCNYDDVSWVRSLVYAGSKSPEGKFYMLSIEGPRVFRFARCPYANIECGELEKVDAVQSFMTKINGSLYPRVMSLKVYNTNVNISHGSGGWEDTRYHKFCHNGTRKLSVE